MGTRSKTRSDAWRSGSRLLRPVATTRKGTWRQRIVSGKGVREDIRREVNSREGDAHISQSSPRSRASYKLVDAPKKTKRFFPRNVTRTRAAHAGCSRQGEEHGDLGGVEAGRKTDEEFGARKTRRSEVGGDGPDEGPAAQSSRQQLCAL